MEEYLASEGEVQGARVVTKLRSGANMLRIDQGRREGLERGERWCEMCGQGVEDEELHDALFEVQERESRDDGGGEEAGGWVWVARGAREMAGHDGRADRRGEGGEYEQGDGGGKEVCGVGVAHSAKDNA